MVLSRNYIFTFKERRVYTKPTEVIPLKEVVGIQTAQEEKGCCFVSVGLMQEIRVNGDSFLFSCES